jgi:hypothetical protein
MANYLCEANGLLDDNFPWSFGMKFVSSLSEASVETTWHASIKGMWDSAGFNALIPATNHFTSTSTSTADGTWHQTTKTTTDEDLVGAGGAALPFRASLIFTWRTAFATKSGHGRWFFPSLTAAALSASGWFYAAGTITAAQTAVEVATAAWSPNLNPLLLNRLALTTTPIIGGDIPDSVATQRRRADKRVPARTSFTV